MPSNDIATFSRIKIRTLEFSTRFHVVEIKQQPLNEIKSRRNSCHPYVDHSQFPTCRLAVSYQSLGQRIYIMATALEEKTYSPEIGEASAQNGFTPEEEKQVLRKVDRFVLPMVRTSILIN